MLLNTCAIREHAEDRVFGNLGALTHTKKERSGAGDLPVRLHTQEPRVSERIKSPIPWIWCFPAPGPVEVPGAFFVAGV